MKKYKVLIGTVVILVLSFLFHSVYDKFPNGFTALFFPVNESIWEHNKMILLSFFVWSIIEKIIFKEKNGSLLVNFFGCLICIILLDATFTPIYLYILKKKENFLIVIILYTISIILGLLLSRKFIKDRDDSFENISLASFVTLFACLAILTYKPLKLPIFYDYSGNFYGIKEK